MDNTMFNLRKTLGNQGEKTAARYLRTKNYQIITTNFTNSSGRCLGEIDIIAKDRTKNELVFVEVKTRKWQKFQTTNPEENVDYRKLQKLNKIAYFYLKQKNLLDHPYRFDVIAIWIDNSLKKAQVRHIEAL